MTIKLPNFQRIYLNFWHAIIQSQIHLQPYQDYAFWLNIYGINNLNLYDHDLSSIFGLKGLVQSFVNDLHLHDVKF